LRVGEAGVPAHPQELTGIGHQFTGIRQLDWILKPLVPAFGQRFRAFSIAS
jgi:hypothetical protein